jgi:hypothetical protein
MSSKQNVLGFIDPSREIRRAPLVGMEFLHQGAVSPPDLGSARSRFYAKDLISLLIRHWPAAARRAAPPRTRVLVSVFTPGGLPAVKIRCE